MGSTIWGQVFVIVNLHIDASARDFDRSLTQGSHTVIVPPCYSHDSNNDQNQEIHPAFDPSTVKLSTHKMNGQSYDIRTATLLCIFDSSNQSFESNTDNETAYGSMQHPKLRLRNPPLTIEIKDPSSK